MAKTLIALTGIGKKYKNRIVLRDIDLRIDAGEIVGLIGQNGSGKSTLLKIIAGVVTPDTGYGSCCDVPLGSNASPFCGLMLEQPPFIENFSGRDNLRALSSLRKSLSLEEIEGIMREVSLESKNRQAVSTYSQGMRQRLGFAQAIMENPPLALLDEPLNGLDPTGIFDIRNLIKKCSDRGMAVLFSSHVLSEVQKICHRVIMLNYGSLQEIDKREFASYKQLEETYKKGTHYCFG